MFFPFEACGRGLFRVYFPFRDIVGTAYLLVEDTPWLWLPVTDVFPHALFGEPWPLDFTPTRSWGGVKWDILVAAVPLSVLRGVVLLIWYSRGTRDVDMVALVVVGVTKLDEVMWRLYCRVVLLVGVSLLVVLNQECLRICLRLGRSSARNSNSHWIKERASVCRWGKEKGRERERGGEKWK